MENGNQASPSTQTSLQNPSTQQSILQNAQTNQQTIQPVEKDHTAIVALLLVFFYPIGAILMWMWMKKWKTWVKVLITLPGVLSILLFLIPIVIYIISALFRL